jgi:hypothetical protein
MNFLDTAKDSAGESLNTLGAFIQKEKDPLEQAFITIFLMLIVAIAMFVAGWALGYGHGVLSK